MLEQHLQVTPVTGGEVSFLGEVSVSELITGDALASAIGLTVGTAQHSNEPWLHFELDGKTLFVAKKPYRHSISWDQIHARGVVYGTTTVTIQGDTYKVRLLKGAASDPASAGTGQDPEPSWGSEWNRLFYPLVPNPTNTPTHPVSQEGITYGAFANYTEAELGVGGSGGNGRYTWCQETRSLTAGINRGSAGLSDFRQITSSNAVSNFGNGYGWRPVLELVE